MQIVFARILILDGACAQDLLAVAVRYAGGWSALLAGRQGLLDTSLPKVLAVLVQHAMSCLDHHGHTVDG